MALTDKQKVKLLKKVIRGLRSALEDSCIDSSACLFGEDPTERPRTKDEDAWILKEYQAERL